MPVELFSEDCGDEVVSILPFGVETPRASKQTLD